MELKNVFILASIRRSRLAKKDFKESVGAEICFCNASFQYG